MKYTKADEEQIRREVGELRPAPDDSLWMETEEIGLSDRWMWALIAFAIVSFASIFIALSLVLLL